MSAVIVHGMSGSGNCHKVRLLLDFLERPYEWVEVNLLQGETRTDGFRRRNPAGQVPVLELPDGQYLPESNAILCYLAEGTDLFPEDRWACVQVLRWLFFEQNAHEPYIAVARFIRKYLPSDHPRRQLLPSLRERGRGALATMDRVLTGSPYMAGRSFTIADIALYAYTHCADQGGFDLAAFPALGAWLRRLEGEAGLKPMAA